MSCNIRSGCAATVTVLDWTVRCCSPVPAHIRKGNVLGRFFRSRTNSSALRKVTNESGWTQLSGKRLGEEVVCCAARMPVQYQHHTVLPNRRQAQQRTALAKKLLRAGKRNSQNAQMVVHVQRAHSSVALRLDIAPHGWKHVRKRPFDLSLFLPHIARPPQAAAAAPARAASVDAVTSLQCQQRERFSNSINRYTYTGAAVPASMRRAFGSAALSRMGNLPKVEAGYPKFLTNNTMGNAPLMMKLLQCDDTMSYVVPALADGFGQPGPWPHTACTEYCAAKTVLPAVNVLLRVASVRSTAATVAALGIAVADLEATMLLLGVGLVTSAFGVLVERAAVKKLVTRWLRGPWLPRLRPVQDYCIAVGVRKQDGCLASLKPGEFPTQGVNACEIVARVLAEVATAAPATAPMSGARVVVLRDAVIPYGAWRWIQHLRERPASARDSFPAPALGSALREDDKSRRAALARQLLHKDIVADDLQECLDDGANPVYISVPCRAV